MKEIRFLACLLFGMALVISCSSDDDNSGGSSGGGAINNGTVNEHQYVDLGLSVRWATNDWGASQSGPGMYNHGVKYSYKLEEINYDVVTAEWGSPWRRPTAEEFQELVAKCTWSIDMTLGGNGCAIITGPNGNKMYLPVNSKFFSRSVFSDTFSKYLIELSVKAYRDDEWNQFQQDKNSNITFDELKEEIKAQPSGYLKGLYTVKELGWEDFKVWLYFLSKDEKYICEVYLYKKDLRYAPLKGYIRPVAPY